MLSPNPKLQKEYLCFYSSILFWCIGIASTTVEPWVLVELFPVFCSLLNSVPSLGFNLLGFDLPPSPTLTNSIESLLPKSLCHLQWIPAPLPLYKRLPRTLGSGARPGSLSHCSPPSLHLLCGGQGQKTLRRECSALLSSGRHDFCPWPDALPNAASLGRHLVIHWLFTVWPPSTGSRSPWASHTLP